MTTETVRYGADPSQVAELTLPTGPARGVVAVVHGGFWKSAYDLSLGRPPAAELVARGWATWNVEYRRVGTGPGGGGGAARTTADVTAALATLRALAPQRGLDLRTVVGLGHSAGGHLAAWAGAGGVLTHVVAQAGVLDLAAAHAAALGDGAVQAFLGHPPGPGDAAYDPAAQVPLAVPVWCVHGRGDDVVPFSFSEEYVARARAAGASAELVAVEGDHMALVDPASPAWARTVAVLDGIAPRDP